VMEKVSVVESGIFPGISRRDGDNRSSTSRGSPRETPSKERLSDAAHPFAAHHQGEGDARAKRNGGEE
jgi:hypothetical protein